MENKVDQELVNRNKVLCEKYPFLRIRSDRENDYRWTVLDDIPDGWRKAFGERMCEEIKLALLEDNDLYNYYVIDVKEKWGRLDWCGNFDTDKLDAVLEKYSDLSSRTCIYCGKTTRYITTGWICPVCEECAKEYDLSVVPVEALDK